MIAIVSDIHANLEAFQAVLEDIRERGIEEIVCLGDIVGYGPDPIECLRLASRCKFCILGNHEEGALSEEGRRNFTTRARAAIEWTREKILASGKDDGSPNPFLQFLGRLPQGKTEGSVHFTHGSPLRPTRDYVFPKDASNRPRMEPIFEKIQHVCFVGHTHLPGVFRDDFTFAAPSDVMGVYIIDERKVMINVGSVGQPRDSDNRASYVTFEEDAVVFRRVEYDYRKTMAKIRSLKELHHTLADRLEKGE